MKNPMEMLKEIKNLLGVELSDQKEIVLAQLKLENGTLLESEDFVKGGEVFILTEDEQVALPVGEYQLEDGRTLEVAEDGVINSIEVKAEEEPEEEIKEEEKEEMKYATKQELEEVKEVVEEIKKMLEPVIEDVVEEVVEEEAELKAELSKPASAPIKHNPESSIDKKQVLYSQKKAETTLDRVLSKINNIKNK